MGGLCLGKQPAFLLLTFLVLETTTSSDDLIATPDNAEWEGGAVDYNEDWEVGGVFGRGHLSADTSPPSGYAYRVSDVDELDIEQGMVKAYVPFESLIYSIPTFTIERSPEGKLPTRTYAPKQVWLTVPKFNSGMYRLSASDDFVIWADEEGHVYELYHSFDNDRFQRRIHFNNTDDSHVRIRSLVATASSRYRVVAVDSEGRFLARCLRAKVSIDCTALGGSSRSMSDESYFWLDLGSAVASYRFKGVAITSASGGSFFLLTTMGHLVEMDCKDRMAVWRLWEGPPDVSLEILADAHVAANHSVFVISSDGELWQILTNKEQSPSTLSSFSSSGGWIRHRHPKDLPLAFMEALAIEPHNHNNGSLFMITKNGQLVEWRIASKNEPTKGLWIVHGIPRSKKGIHKIKKSKKSKGSESFKNTKLPSRAGEGEGLKLMTAPMAIRSKHTVYLYSISNDHNLQEFQLASKPENGKKTQSHWVTHVMPNRLAFVRGVASRNTLWFQQEDGVLVERKILELNPTMRVQPWSKLPKNASKSVSSTVAKPSSSLSPSSSLPSSLPSASSSSSSSSPSSSSSSTMKSPSTRSQSRARSRASRKITSRSSSLASYSFVAYALDDFAHRIRTFHAKNTGYNQVDDTPHDMMKNSNTIPH